MTVTDEIITSDDALREEAVKRLRKKEDLRGHLLVYVLANALVWTVWAMTLERLPVARPDVGVLGDRAGHERVGCLRPASDRRGRCAARGRARPRRR